MIVFKFCGHTGDEGERDGRGEAPQPRVPFLVFTEVRGPHVRPSWWCCARRNALPLCAQRLRTSVTWSYGGEVTTERQQLAGEPKTFCDSMGISIREYARRLPGDAGAMCRYLNGTRRPPESFIKELLHDVAQHRDTPLSSEVIALIWRLHRQVLVAETAPWSRIQLLEKDLAQTLGRADDAERTLREKDDQPRQAGRGLGPGSPWISSPRTRPRPRPNSTPTAFWLAGAGTEASDTA
jgi:hypothetical protein